VSTVIDEALLGVILTTLFLLWYKVGKLEGKVQQILQILDPESKEAEQ
jgi:hypothetical protein